MLYPNNGNGNTKEKLMTDKIIIDGVDVSECRYFEVKRYNDDIFCRKFALPCDLGQEPCTSCYYKQLARKTEECENNKIAYQNELNIYDKACADLKSELEDAYSELQAEKQKSEKYKQALEEIKSALYATSEFDNWECEHGAPLDKCVNEDCLHSRVYKILQKCEVLIK